jgi:hypothetical protein
MIFVMMGKVYSMKLMKEKLKRIVKYWRVWYKQASGSDRLHLGMCALVVLVYAWWVLLVI